MNEMHERDLAEAQRAREKRKAQAMEFARRQEEESRRRLEESKREQEEMRQRAIAAQQEFFERAQREKESLVREGKALEEKRRQQAAAEEKRKAEQREAAALPWSNPTEASYHVFIDSDIWDLRTCKPVVQKWAKYRPSNPRLIRNAPRRLASIQKPSDTSDRSSLRNRILGLFYGDGSELRVSDIHLRAGEIRPEGIRMACEFMRDDFRRVLFFSNGDLWRATIDWNAGELVGAKQVTNVGLLKDKPILHWYGNTAWIGAGFDSQRPVLQVNLLTGQSKEMDTLEVFDLSERSSMLSNPAGDLLVRFSDGLVYSYDLRSNSTRTSPNRFVIRALEKSEFPKMIPIFYGNGVSNPNWIGDRKALPETLDRKILLVDLESHAAVDLTPRAEEKYLIVGPLPGARQVEATIPGDRHEGPDIPKSKQVRFLIDVADGKQTPLPVTMANESRWLNENELLYVKTDGGLSEVGTWLHDRVAGTNVRVTPHQVAFSNLVWMPEHRWLCGQRRDGKYVKLELPADKPATMTELETKETGPFIRSGTVATIDTREAELGFGEDAADPWRETADLFASLPTQKGELRGVPAVKHLLRDDPPEIREFGIKAYRYASKDELLSQIYDPFKVVDRFMQHYRKNPVDDGTLPLQALLTSVDLSGCVDPEVAEIHFAERAARKLFYFRDRYNKQQLESLTVEIAKTATRILVKNPPKDLAATDAALFAAADEAMKKAPRKGR